MCHLSYHKIRTPVPSTKLNNLEILTAMAFYILTLVILSTAGYIVLGYPLHAQCEINWQFPSVSCDDFADKITSQMKLWQTADNCQQGGEKCLYEIKSQSDTQIKGTHSTPVKKYVDDLTFTLTPQGSGCNVKAYSRSETWYAYLDFGTNYCNLRNLIDGASLSNSTGFKEVTSDSVCTQYSSHDCDKY